MPDDLEAGLVKDGKTPSKKVHISILETNRKYVASEKRDIQKIAKLGVR